MLDRLRVNARQAYSWGVKTVMVQVLANEIVATTRIPPNRWSRLPTAGEGVWAVQIGQPQRSHRRSRLHHAIESNRAYRRRKNVSRTQETIRVLGRRAGWRRTETGSGVGTSRPESDSMPIYRCWITADSRGLRKNRPRLAGKGANRGCSGLSNQVAGCFRKTGALCDDVYARSSGSAGGRTRSSNCEKVGMDRAQTSRSMSRRVGGARRPQQPIRLSRRMHSTRPYHMSAKVA